MSWPFKQTRSKEAAKPSTACWWQWSIERNRNGQARRPFNGEFLSSVLPGAGFGVHDGDANQFVSIVMIDDAAFHFTVGRPLRFPQTDIEHIRFLVVVEP